jgi:hypothetical protein
MAPAAQRGSKPPSELARALQEHHERCGVTELAGKAVGAAFVGVTAGCLAIAETLRELHGGTGHDTILINLATTTARTSPSGQAARVPSARLVI